MKHRIQFGTDIATVGIWDLELNLPPFAPRDFPDGLRADAEEGKVFLFETGADCGGVLEVFINSELPLELDRKCRPIGVELMVPQAGGTVYVEALEPGLLGRTVKVSPKPGSAGRSGRNQALARHAGARTNSGTERHARGQ